NPILTFLSSKRNTAPLDCPTLASLLLGDSQIPWTSGAYSSCLSNRGQFLSFRVEVSVRSRLVLLSLCVLILVPAVSAVTQNSAAASSAAGSKAALTGTVSDQTG